MAATEPRDDFSIFAGAEHMFFGLQAPYAYFREQIEAPLQEQVPGTLVERIVCFEQPKWLTLGRKIEGDERHVTVGHYGVCFRCTVDVRAGDYVESLDATVTALFCDVDRDARARISMDVHADAVRAFDDAVFQQRFLAFRHENSLSGGRAPG